MYKAMTMIMVIIVLMTATLAEAITVRLSGAFGASVYKIKPEVSYAGNSGWSIPANYVLSGAGQARSLPLDLIGFLSWDRTWSGNEDEFWNSSNVMTAGIGKSFVLGYSEVELLAGICRYTETFSLDPSGGGSEEVEDSRIGGLFGMQLVFPFFENVQAITSYRLVVRAEGTLDGKLDSNRSFTIQTNTVDHMISFGLGYLFGE